MYFKVEFDEATRKSAETFSARVLADSLHPDGVTRLTTVEMTYCRAIHSEFLTHREFSRNAASSRAIPITTMVQRVRENPFFPLHWGKNQKGMQADTELSGEQALRAASEWMWARAQAIEAVERLSDIGIHKQIGNRILEPWMWITVIASSTNFENLFALRCHRDAEPHFQHLAYKLRDAYDASTPRPLAYGDWHLPLIGFDGDKDLPAKDLPKIAAGRCARVSYLTHTGERDPAADIALYDRLSSAKPLHASPLEHPAIVVPQDSRTDWGNFKPGFCQLRKMLADECVFTRRSVT